MFDFCSKIKVVKIMFWLYHHVEEKETSTLVKTVWKSDFKHGRTCHHTPARWLPMRVARRHSSSSPEWADPTQIPEDPTHMPDPGKNDVIMAPTCIVGMPCQLTHQHSGTHLPRRRHESSGVANGRCEGYNRSPIVEHPRVNVMAWYKWTSA